MEEDCDRSEEELWIQVKMERKLMVLQALICIVGKEEVDGYFDGSFTSKDVEAKWDLLKIIQSNIEDWDCDKGK
jgi:hypothetical protein